MSSVYGHFPVKHYIHTYAIDTKDVVYLLVLPFKNRTPSPSATAISCALLDFIRRLMALRRVDIGTPESSDGTGGSMIS